MSRAARLQQRMVWRNPTLRRTLAHESPPASLIPEQLYPTWVGAVSGAVNFVLEISRFKLVAKSMPCICCVHRSTHAISIVSQYPYRCGLWARVGACLSLCVCGRRVAVHDLLQSGSPQGALTACRRCRRVMLISCGAIGTSILGEGSRSNGHNGEAHYPKRTKMMR